MLLEYDDDLDTTRSTELSIFQLIDRIAGVSSNNCMLRTDRDHEQKLVLTCLFALSPVAVSRSWSCGPCQSIPCI